MKAFSTRIFFKIFIIISLLMVSLSAVAYEEELFGDEIFLEVETIKLNLDKTIPAAYKQSLEKPENGLEYRLKGLSIFSNSKTELNDYMTNDYKTSTGATLNPDGRFSLTGGVEVKYQNPDASINSKKLYLTPNLKLNDEFFLTFSNKFNQDSKIYENEVGIKYSPRFFKDSSFGVSAGTVFDEEVIKSQKLKFTTDFFLF